MNLKGMIVSIVTAMLVMTMFASSAMAITVDGRIDPSDEWNSWKLGDDDDMGNPLPLVNGFNISTVWQHYVASEDKLYFRYDTVGIAGDSSGNGNPNTPADDQNDQWGVGVPNNPAVYNPREGYTVAINADNDIATGKHIRGYDGFDIILNYQNDIAAVEWIGIAEPSGFIAEAEIATAYPFTHVVEFSINKVSEYMDPRLYVLYGYAGSDMDQENPEDPLLEPFEVVEFDLDFKGICCYNMEFNGTMSFGSIVNHTWDFGDGDSEYIVGPPGVVTHQYSRGGLPKFTVTLSGYNALGQYAEVSQEVYVDKGPTAKATVVPTKVEVNNPTSVKFDGSASHADPSGDPLRTITHEWSFSDGTYDSGHIVYKTVTLGPGETLSATLTVNDSHCEKHVPVYVTTKPPQEVPLLTLPGLLALIGMMCIVGAGRILTKGRRS
jgi:hypothetical protein